MTRRLESRVAVVTGASRRAGRGIALVLGEEGATQQPFDLSGTESPEYVGRAVAALAADPGEMAKSGRVLRVGDLAQEYGFTDVDGRQIPAFQLPNAP